MSPEQSEASRKSIEGAYAIRNIARNTYGTKDGRSVLGMHFLESTAGETDPSMVKPELVAHWNTLLYNLGIGKHNLDAMIDALMSIANDDDLDAEMAALAKEDE